MHVDVSNFAISHKFCNISQIFTNFSTVAVSCIFVDYIYIYIYIYILPFDPKMVEIFKIILTGSYWSEYSGV